MKNKFVLFGLLLMLGISTACTSGSQADDDVGDSPATEEPAQDNSLTAAEKEAGWELLFDGKNMSKWRLYSKDTLVGWAVNNGEMQALGLDGSGNDIITKETFSDFELSLEWKISKAGNSGVFFNVILDEDLNSVYQSGPEYQLIDDEGFPAELADWQKTGANYAMHLAPDAKTKPVGEFNHTRIIVNNGKVEHWLNGDKIVEYELWTDDWKKRKEEGKWKDYPKYGEAKSGHIALQDHGNMCWFKNIKIREL